MSAQLHKLSDHLGDELIKKRRRKLCKRALAVGLPIYAEKPGQFQTRLRQYFQQWS